MYNFSATSVSFDNFEKDYPSVEFKEPGLYLINGPSGSGKSTFVGLFLRQIERRSKDIVLVCRGSNMVFSTSLENVLGQNNILLDEELLSVFNVEKPLLSQNPLTLSYGQQRRLTLLGQLALLNQNCDLVILDEVFLSIDNNNAIRILTWIKNRFKYVIMITHNEVLKNQAKYRIEIGK